MKCDGCTLCCKLANISDTLAPHGEYCVNCVPGACCVIHSHRPANCVTFQCAYSQMEKVHPDLKPDKCGVLFEKISDTLMLATTEGVLGKMKPIIKGQIDSFIKEGISVMLQQFKPHKFICFQAKGSDRKEIVQALEDKTNDSSLIH